MLTVRQSQLTTFSEARRSVFLARLLRVFENDYPVEFARLGREKAEEFAKRTLTASERFGLERENAILVYLGLRVEFGENFEKSPDRDWAIELLSHPKVPDVLKVSIVRDRFRERTQGRQIETIRTSDEATSE